MFQVTQQVNARGTSCIRTKSMFSCINTDLIHTCTLESTLSCVFPHDIHFLLLPEYSIIRRFNFSYDNSTMNTCRIQVHWISILHVYMFKFSFVLSIQHIIKNIFYAELIKKKSLIGLLCIRCFIIFCELIWIIKISNSSWMIFFIKFYHTDFVCPKEWKWTLFPLHLVNR